MALTRLCLQGFKTIEKLELELGALTVLIGPNGAGKSNLVSFFRLLSYLASEDLRTYVAKEGGASRLLFDGPKRTRDIEASLEFDDGDRHNRYAFRLTHSGRDKLIFADERYRYWAGDGAPPQWRSFERYEEAGVVEAAGQGGQTAGVILSLLQKVIVHQFHDTSKEARIRNKWRVNEGRWLKEDAGNLAAFLYRLKAQEPVYYRRIVSAIRLVLPFFHDFELEPEYDSILLQWRETGSDEMFDASQASDGMLRLMALVSLLSQPEKDLPKVLILDEPELGLHPSAIGLVAGLMRSASVHAQLIVCTQSPSLVDHFEARDIVVVDREARASTFQRLEPWALKEWLEEFSLSEIWEKNLIGGRP